MFSGDIQLIKVTVKQDFQKEELKQDQPLRFMGLRVELTLTPTTSSSSNFPSFQYRCIQDA
jgi:hypothetical protein